MYTYEDELRTILDSWRNIYASFPWLELAVKYRDGDTSALYDIEKERKKNNITVNIEFS